MARTKETTNIDAISKLSVRSKALSIAAYGFSNLYKNIPHNKLENSVGDVIISVSKIVYCCNKFGATRADNKSKFKTTFDKTSLKLVISFLLLTVILTSLICHFSKTVKFPWVLKGHLKWLIYFFVTTKIMAKNTKQRDLEKARLFSVCFYQKSSVCYKR